MDQNPEHIGRDGVPQFIKQSPTYQHKAGEAQNQGVSPNKQRNPMVQRQKSQNKVQTKNKQTK